MFESNEDVEVLKEVFRDGLPKGFSVEEAVNFAISFTPVIVLPIVKTKIHKI